MYTRYNECREVTIKNNRFHFVSQWIKNILKKKRKKKKKKREVIIKKDTTFNVTWLRVYVFFCLSVIFFVFSVSCDAMGYRVSLILIFQF